MATRRLNILTDNLESIIILLILAVNRHAEVPDVGSKTILIVTQVVWCIGNPWIETIFALADCRLHCYHSRESCQVHSIIIQFLLV